MILYICLKIFFNKIYMRNLITITFFVLLFFNNSIVVNASNVDLWNIWLWVNLEYNSKSLSQFNSNDNYILMNSSINPNTTMISNNFHFSTSNSNLKYWILVARTGIFPSDFSDYTNNQRNDYIVENICKNSDYNSYIHYNNLDSDFYLSSNYLERTISTGRKAFVICFKDGWDYSAFWWNYRLNNRNDIWLSDVSLTWYDYDVVYWPNGFVINYESSDFVNRGTYYYISENNCSYYVDDYENEVTSYDKIEILLPEWDSTWEKRKKLCVVEKKFNYYYWREEYKFEEQLLTYTFDWDKPVINIGTNWDENLWYSDPIDIEITCKDSYLYDCVALYWNEVSEKEALWNNELKINKTLWNNAVNTLFIEANDRFWNKKNLNKSFKLDNFKPNLDIFLTEKIVDNVIVSMTVSAFCNDNNLSWCNFSSFNGSLFPVAENGITYFKKEFTENVTETISIKDNVGNLTAKEFTITTIGKELSWWYGLKYQDPDNVNWIDISVAQKNNWAITTCWQPASCIGSSSENDCDEFDTAPSTLNNGYQTYTRTTGGLAYKANHKLFEVETNRIGCKYYDWHAPEFELQVQKTVYAGNWNIEYVFKSISDQWSGLKKITIKSTLEDWTTNTVFKEVNEDTPVDSFNLIDLGIAKKSIDNVDYDSNWYAQINLEIKVEDWTENIKIENDIIYLIPDIENLNTANSKIKTIVGKPYADLTDHYEYKITLEDNHWNNIKNIDIENILKLEIKPDDIVFNNTFIDTDSIYNEYCDKLGVICYSPIYYKFPWKTSIDNSSGIFTFNGELDDWEIEFSVYSKVPTYDSYEFDLWKIKLDTFNVKIYLDWTEINSFDFKDIDNLDFYDSLTTRQFDISDFLNDNTLNSFKATLNSGSTDFRFDNIILFITYNNSDLDLLNKFEIIDLAIKEDKNWELQFTIEANKDYDLLLNSNGLWLEDLKIEWFLEKNTSKANWESTFYKIFEKNYGEEETSDRDIDIKWIADTEDSWYWDNILKTDVSLDNIDVNKSEIVKNIKKQVANYTKNLANKVTTKKDYTVNLDEPSNTINWEKIFYYDFSWKECGISYNDYNKWCNVIINTSEIIGKNNIIVKWWNLILNSDMYYGENSMIWYYVFRDSSNMKNGWNVYINENITNAVWILYSEWSVMSINNSNNKIYDWKNAWPNDLLKQLLWYWSIFSKNTVWWTINYLNNQDDLSLSCPYWTDAYIASSWNISTAECTEVEANRYDFSLLRRFQSRVGYDGNCNGSYYAINWNWNKIDNAFIQWKTCFDSTSGYNYLRKTDNYKSSFVVEYDSRVQSNPLLIIK